MSNLLSLEGLEASEILTMLKAIEMLFVKILHLLSRITSCVLYEICQAVNEGLRNFKAYLIFV